MNWFMPFRVHITLIFAGLVSAHLIASLYIYDTNLSLSKTIIAVSHAGYVPVPNLRLIPMLSSYHTALISALFFTLSAGSGITLLTYLLVWLWHHHRRSWIAQVMIMLSCLISLNEHGFNFWTSLLFIGVPIAVIAAYRLSKMYLKTVMVTDPLVNFFYFLIVAYVLMLLVVIKPDSDYAFFFVRDRFLFSNPMGLKINDFYYKYNLFPTEAFKSLEQKLMKTCYIQNSSSISSSDLALLERKMSESDYILFKHDPVGEIDCVIHILNQHNIDLINQDKPIIHTSLSEFLKHSKRIFTDFSNKSDRFSFFRQFTFYSLILAFPILMVWIMIVGLSVLFSLMMSQKHATIVSSIMVIICYVILMYCTYSLRCDQEALQHENNLCSIYKIYQEKLEVSNFPTYKHVMSNSNIAETYWLLKTMAFSKTPETVSDIRHFLNSPHINLVCMALYAGSCRKDQVIIQYAWAKLNNSEHWYEQQYAYQALKELGWRQTSGSKP
ncbi:MAG: hypothetical protein HQK77_17315 [Desulfobacterales bacterium]|nr:hypothetical protein [Desulfobacterales bacterium]